MPALYHLLQAQPRQLDEKLLDYSHPPWNDREEKLHIPFAAAGKEFDDLWPDRFASPGGNPPIVVYSGLPLSRRNLRGELEMSVPLHCDNLYGSVAVVLRLTTSGLVRELRQYTGCTSNHTFVTFTVADTDGQLTRSPVQAMISILDDRGSLLARSLAPQRLR